MEMLLHTQVLSLMFVVGIARKDQDVRLPPIITNQNADPIHYKQMGNEVELYCEADGHPAPVYEWKKDGQILDINTASVESIPGGILLKDLGYEHQGEYQCFASNPFGTTVTNLNSVFIPFISGYPPNEPTEVYMVDEGDPLKMICKSVKSLPMENTRQDWTTVIDRGSSDHTVIILDRRVQQDDLGNLMFSYVTKNDEKDGYLYRCQVTNAVAAISTFGSWSTITVNEVDPPVNFVPPKIQFNTGETTGDTVVALKREQISLRCLFSGKPPPEVSWSRVGGDMDHDRMKKSQLNTVLTISYVRDSDEGHYQCTGTNQQKRISDSKIITVNVEAKPFFEDPETKPRNTNKTDGEDVRFRCDPDAEPPAEITWMMNGDILEGLTIPPRVSIIENGRTLLIKDVCKKCPGYRSDLKVYQCLAENKHGSVFVSSYLNILSPTELTEHHEDIELVYNKLVEFKCDGQSDDSTPVTFSWLLDNQRIEYIEDRIWLEEEGRVIKLQTKNLGEEVLNYVGNYTCIVSNGYSQAKWTAALIMPQDSPPDVITPEGPTNPTTSIYVGILAGGLVLGGIITSVVILKRRRRRQSSPPDNVNNAVTMELMPQVTSSHHGNTGGDVEYEIVDTDTYYATIRDSDVTDYQNVNDQMGDYLTPITYTDATNGDHLTTTTNIDDANGDSLTPTTNTDATNGDYLTTTTNIDDANGDYLTPITYTDATNGDHLTTTTNIDDANGDYLTPTTNTDATNGDYLTTTTNIDDANGDYLTPITYNDATNGDYLTTTTNIDDANGDYLTPTANTDNAYEMLAESRGDCVNVNESSAPKVYTSLQANTP